MIYHDWKALCETDPAKANALCAEAMGWRYYRHQHGEQWMDSEGFPRWLVKDFQPITDRNATALMVERVVERSRMARFSDAILASGEWLDVNFMVVSALLIPPDLIAWACCEALRPDLAASGADRGARGHKGTKEET